MSFGLGVAGARTNKAGLTAIPSNLAVDGVSVGVGAEAGKVVLGSTLGTPALAQLTTNREVAMNNKSFQFSFDAIGNAVFKLDPANKIYWIGDRNGAANSTYVLVHDTNKQITLNANPVGNIAIADGTTGCVGIGNFSAFNATRLDVVDNAIAGASIMNISTTSVNAATNLQKGLNVNLSGANTNNNQTTFAVDVANSHSGTGNVNYGIRATISNDANAGSFALAGFSNNGIAVTGQSQNSIGGFFTSPNIAMQASGSGAVTAGVIQNSSTGKGASITAIADIACEVIRTPGSDTIVEVLRVQANRSGGGAGAGFGCQINFDLHNSTNSVQLACAISAAWTTATNGSESSDMTLNTKLTGTSNARVKIKSNGSVLLNAIGAALATNATDGFVYIASCAGTPTGAATAQTGMVPMVYDTTNNKIAVFNGGAWKQTVALT